LADEYRGHWSSGFETSTFVPCGGGLPGGVWVAWEDSAYTRALRNWPRVRERDGIVQYFVRWRGALRGPRAAADTIGDTIRLGTGYGHLGVSAYELRVAELLEMRAPPRRDCDR
jgi:hypothetical protein